MTDLSCPPGAAVRGRLALLLVAILAATGLVAFGPASGADAASEAGSAPSARVQAAATYSAPLRTAVRDLPVATEVRTGYSRDLFPHWDDADGDGCDTRREVLIDEATTRPTVGSGCSLTNGRWLSYYDRVSHTDITTLSIDHMIALAEAWDSGARSWSASDRRRFANDLGDSRALVAVTSGVNSSKGDRDPAEWLPEFDRCRYVTEWTATKHRWRLTVDSAERSRLISLADGCSNVTVTVTQAR